MTRASVMKHVLVALALCAYQASSQATTTTTWSSIPLTKIEAASDCASRNGVLPTPTRNGDVNRLVEFVETYATFTASDDVFCVWLAPTKSTSTDDCVDSLGKQAAYYKENFGGFVKLHGSTQSIDNRCDIEKSTKRVRKFINGRFRWVDVVDKAVTKRDEPAENNVALCFKSGGKQVAYYDQGDDVKFMYACEQELALAETCTAEFAYSEKRMTYNQGVAFCSNLGYTMPDKDKHKVAVKADKETRFKNGFWFLNKEHSGGNRRTYFVVCVKEDCVRNMGELNINLVPPHTIAVDYTPDSAINPQPNYMASHTLAAVDPWNNNAALSKYSPLHDSLDVSFITDILGNIIGMTLSGFVENNDPNNNGTLYINVTFGGATTYAACTTSTNCPSCEYDFCVGSAKEDWVYFPTLTGTISGNDMATFNPALGANGVCVVTIEGLKYPQLGVLGANGKSNLLGLASWFACEGDGSTPGYPHADFNLELHGGTAPPTSFGQNNFVPTIAPTGSPNNPTFAPTSSPTFNPTTTPTSSPTTEICFFPYMVNDTLTQSELSRISHFLVAVDCNNSATAKWVPQDGFLQGSLQDFDNDGQIDQLSFSGTLVNIGFNNNGTDTGKELFVQVTASGSFGFDQCQNEGGLGTMDCPKCERDYCDAGNPFTDWTFFNTVTGTISGEDIQNLYPGIQGDTCVIDSSSFFKAQLGTDTANGKNTKFGFSVWFTCEGSNHTEKHVADFNVDIDLCITPSPTVDPNNQPGFPSPSPIFVPTEKPTFEPTNNPTFYPTESPTTLEPTLNPTSGPTFSPTGNPTSSPTTPAPTFSPTTSPTFNPTSSPTSFPTAAPSTPIPTTDPTQNPTSSPTTSPTQNPTAPTISPTQFPTLTPTSSPTVEMCAYPYTADQNISQTIGYGNEHFLVGLDDAGLAQSKYVPNNPPRLLPAIFTYNGLGQIETLSIQGELVNIGFPTPIEAGGLLTFDILLSDPISLTDCIIDTLDCGNCELGLCVPGAGNPQGQWQYFQTLTGSISGSDLFTFFPNLNSSYSECVITSNNYPLPQVGPLGANGKNLLNGMSFWFDCEGSPADPDFPVADFNIDLAPCNFGAPSASPSYQPSFSPTEIPTSTPVDFGNGEPTSSPTINPTTSPSTTSPSG